MNEKTLRKKLSEMGYSLRKGFVHYLGNGALVYDKNGNKIPGYTVFNYRTGFYEWGSYDNYFDHLWSLKDVESFLKSIA